MFEFEHIRYIHLFDKCFKVLCIPQFFSLSYVGKRKKRDQIQHISFFLIQNIYSKNFFYQYRVSLTLLESCILPLCSLNRNLLSIHSFIVCFSIHTHKSSFRIFFLFLCLTQESLVFGKFKKTYN